MTLSFTDRLTHITGDKPGVQLEGTEADAENLVIRENAGGIQLYDATNDTTAGSWNLDPPIENTSLGGLGFTRNLQPEGAVENLAADSTGIKYEGRSAQLLDPEILNSQREIALEVSKESSAGDEDVTIELYNGTSVVTSITVSGTSDRERTADLSDSLDVGDNIIARWNVTATSGTSGATFNAVAARLVIL